MVKEILDHGDRSWSELGFICDDIRNLGRRFRSLEVAYTPRSGNEAAHFFTQKALGTGTSKVRLEEAPSDVLSILLADCNVLTS